MEKSKCVKEVETALRQTTHKTYIFCEFFQLYFGRCFLFAMNKYRQILVHVQCLSCNIQMYLMNYYYLFRARERNINAFHAASFVDISSVFFFFFLTFDMWFASMACVVYTVDRTNKTSVDNVDETSFRAVRVRNNTQSMVGNGMVGTCILCVIHVFM